MNAPRALRICCCRRVCRSCEDKVGDECPLCRVPLAKSDAEAIARLRRHVENEVPEAIACLGDVYREGAYGHVASAKKAAKLYKRAVELGNVNAMNNLGHFYNNGLGVKLDKKKAERLYRMASDRGDPRAQNNMGGHLHQTGDLEGSFHYWRLSAEQGLLQAQHNVGCAYLHGRGVERDREEAKRWFARAAARGFEPCIDALAKLAEGGY